MKRLGAATPGSGRAGLKRLKTPQKGCVEGALTKPAIKRLARRAGVKRIGGGVGEAAQMALRIWLAPLIKAAVCRAEHARRFTVTLNDIMLSLKNNALAGRGITLYGFEERARKRQQLTRRLARHVLEEAHALATGMQAAAGSGWQQDDLEEVPREEQEPEQQPPKQQQQPPKACAATSSSPCPITPERSSEIQAELCNLWDSLQRESEVEVAVPRALNWVSSRLCSKGHAACLPLEFDTVLTALEHQNAIMLVEPAGGPRTMIFTA